MTDTWKEVSNSITKEFIFDNFAQALAFVNNVGAEKIDSLTVR